MFDIAPFEHCIDNVHPATVQHIIKVESNNRPYAINVNKLHQKSKPRYTQPKTKQDAIEKANYYISLGHSVDLGLMQVNSNNLLTYGVSVSDMFDECRNINIGSKILLEAYTRAIRRFPEPQVALRHALSVYNTGNFTKGFHNGYVDKYPPLINPISNKSIYTADTRISVNNLYN